MLWFLFIVNRLTLVEVLPDSQLAALLARRFVRTLDGYHLVKTTHAHTHTQRERERERVIYNYIER